MLSLLGAESDTSFWGSYGLMIVLFVLLIGFVIFSSIRRKKYDGQVQNLLDNLKIGDHVKTYSGFYGKIVSIRETTDGKVVLIEMGEGDKKGYIEADINAVMCLDKKEDVVYDSNGNLVETKQEEKQEENKEEHVSTADKLREKKAKKEKKAKDEESKEESVEEKAEDLDSKVSE